MAVAIPIGSSLLCRLKFKPVAATTFPYIPVISYSLSTARPNSVYRTSSRPSLWRLSIWNPFCHLSKSSDPVLSQHASTLPSSTVPTGFFLHVYRGGATLWSDSLGPSKGLNFFAEPNEDGIFQYNVTEKVDGMRGKVISILFWNPRTLRPSFYVRSVRFRRKRLERDLWLCAIWGIHWRCLEP